MDQEVKLMNKVIQQDNYNVVAKLSEGSYGQIFLVQHKQTGQKYVLKALQLAKLQKQQRVHEAYIQSLILRKLDHPGIIKIHSTIKRQNYFSQILDYCPYGDLFKLIAKINSHIALIKNKKQIVRFYLAQMLQALCYIHEKQIIHRDFKPQNIVLGRNLSIKLIDFGTVKINNNQYLSQIEKQSINDLKLSNSNKQLVGSAHYLSPQALKCEYSQKSDIWAFGVIVYKFYHNSLPFIGANNFEIFKCIKEKQPEIQESIPLDVRQIIQVCLKKNPEQRPTAAMLKYYSFFKDVNFSTIFSVKAPLSAQDLQINTSSLSPKKGQNQNQQLFEVILEKKMFFGNYKPRILALYRKRNILYFAYKYVDTRITKNQVELNMNDYCQKASKNEFEIKCDDKQYTFKCLNNQNVDKIVQEINFIIKDHFKLD